MAHFFLKKAVANQCANQIPWNKALWLDVANHVTSFNQRYLIQQSLAQKYLNSFNFCIQIGANSFYSFSQYQTRSRQQPTLNFLKCFQKQLSK